MMRKVFAAILALLAAGAARAEPVTIAALGDSLTQGYGLVQEQGLVPQLQRWLDESGADVTLINAGVSGDTTAGGAARIGWTLTPDVDAVIVTLGGNDLLRGLDPAVARDNLGTILRVAQEAGVEVLLVGMTAPGNYGPDYKAAFDAIYADLAEAYGALLMPSFFAGFGDAATDPAGAAALMQADGIHPNAAGVARIVDAMGPHVLDLIARVGPKG